MLKEENNKLLDTTPFKYKTKTRLISDCLISHLKFGAHTEGKPI